MAKQPKSTFESRKTQNFSQTVWGLGSGQQIPITVLQQLLQDILDSYGNTESVPEGYVGYMSSTDGVLAPSPYRRQSSGNAFIEGTPRFEATSAEIGPGLKLSGLNSFLAATNDQVDDVQFVFIDARQRKTGPSDRPRQFALSEAENQFNIETEMGDTITTNPLAFEYRVTLDSQTNAVMFRVAQQMTNVRVRVSYGEGNQAIIRYLPNEQAWIDGTGGLTLDTGLQTIDFGDSQMRTFATNLPPGAQPDLIRVEVQADNVSLLGDQATGFPYLAVMLQRGEFLELSYLKDLQEQTFKNSVRYKTTGNVTLSGTQTVDGATPAQGDRILVASQTDASENGIYDYNGTGAWTRSSDFDTSEKVNQGAMLFVRQGTANPNTLWYMTTTTTITLGTTDLAFVQFQPGGATGTAPITSVQSYSATGTQNFGSNLSATLHIMESTVTSFDLLTAASADNNSFFAIQNQSTATIEFDVSANALDFIGTSDADAYDIAAGAIALFYVNGNGIYVMADTGTAGAAGDDHPITLTRDTPSLTTLAALADASTNDNSAVWIVASNQVAATESGVDSSIMIRALAGGILDANGVELSTTAVAKSGVVLAGGTIVRVFSSTDLRVVSGPGMVAQTMRYPDLPFSGSIEIGETLPSSQGTYESYRGRTATNAGGTTNQYIRMPSLHSAERPSWVREGDVFVMRHTGTSTGSQRPSFRVDNTGDTIAGNNFQYWADPGETIAIQAPPVGQRTWRLFPVSQRSDGGTYYDPEQIMGEWYLTPDDALAADHSVQLNHDEQFEDSVVRDHVKSSTDSSGLISLTFEQHDPADDIGWIQWLTTWDSNIPALGSTIEAIDDEITAALAYIGASVSNTLQFEFGDPGLGGGFGAAIEALTHLTGDTYRVEFASGTTLPSYLSVNDTITISGSSNSENNGDFAITAIAADREDFEFTNVNGNGAASNTGLSGSVGRQIYATSALVSNTYRRHNFRLYLDSDRTNQLTAVPSDWFDIATDPVPDDNLLNGIGYNNSLTRLASQFSTQDRTGGRYAILGGPRKTVNYFDNRGGEYVNSRTLPLAYERIHLDTGGTANFYLEVFPDELDIGEARDYVIRALATNDDDDTKIFVGQSGNTVTSDEGIERFTVRPGTSITISMYNDGENSGWHLGSGFEKSFGFVTQLTTAVASDNSDANPLPVNVSLIPQAQNQDANRDIITLVGDDELELKADVDVEVECALRFFRSGGSTPTGPANALVQIMPIVTPSGGSAADQGLFSVPTELDLNSSVGAVARLSFRWVGTEGDRIKFEPRVSNLPAGYTASDISVVDWRCFRVTSKSQGV